MRPSLTLACLVVCLLDPTRGSGPAAASGTLPVLTTVDAIRQLTAEEAIRGYPVRIRGVISLNHPHATLMFVQDDSGGIYVSPEKLPWPEKERLSRGTLVEIEGRTSFGRFSPFVCGREGVPVQVKVLGRTGLPEPLRLSLDQLADPRYQNQWIELSGVVRCVASDTVFNGAVEVVAVTVASPSGRATMATFRFPPGEKLPTELVGATIRVRGVFTAVFTNNRQYLGMYLVTSSLEDLHVLGPLPGEPFALPIRPIACLMQFEARHSVAERVRIQGTVIQAVAGRGMYVEDKDAAVWVKTLKAPQVRLGDQVDVAGFPAQGGWKPILEDAVYRFRGPGQVPVPPAITVEKALSGNYDCRRVVMEGLLLQASLNPEQPTLLLQSGDKMFLAKLADVSYFSNLATADNSWLRVEGICVNSGREDLLKHVPPELGEPPGPVAFHLLVASPADVTVLKKPSWWTTLRILAVVGGTLFVAVAALLWVIVLRYRIAVQTRIIRRQLAREAVYEERGRIARELHDTLEQELAGISLQMDTANAKLPTAPETARNCSIWPAPCSSTVAPRPVAPSWTCGRRSWNAATWPRPFKNWRCRPARDSRFPWRWLSKGCRAACLARSRRICSASRRRRSTNALKHGKPDHVKLCLAFGQKEVVLHLEDDGPGFDVEQALTLRAGHFGLLGMRERARESMAVSKSRACRGREQPFRSRPKTPYRKGTTREENHEDPPASGGRSFRRASGPGGCHQCRTGHDGCGGVRQR